MRYGTPLSFSNFDILHFNIWSSLISSIFLTFPHTSHSFSPLLRPLALLSTLVLFLGLTADFLRGHKPSIPACLSILYSLLVNFVIGTRQQKEAKWMRGWTFMTFVKRLHIPFSLTILWTCVCLFLHVCMCVCVLCCVTNGKGGAESSSEPLL